MHGRIAILISTASMLLIGAGCAPFAEMQDARLVGEGRTELTPGVSGVSYVNEGESAEAYDHYGVQWARGIGENTDLRGRFEHVVMESDGDDKVSYNVIGFGPKFGLTEGFSAVYLPVGFAFGDYVEEGDTFQFHPTLLFTVPLATGVDLNPSAKALIPLVENGGDSLVAINVGLGLSTDPERWILRPEVGFLFNPGEDGHYQHLSLGMTFFP